MNQVNRCAWARDELMISYHDLEWGVPVHDERRHFEMLCLEGAQAGLSWNTILKKRANYLRVFEGFDPAAIAEWDDARINQALTDPGIVRHRGKIASVVTNARVYLAIQKECQSFDRYVWSYVGNQPRINHWSSLGEIPSQTSESDTLSRDLRRRGFRFVGTTICYAYMQAVGLVNDHTTDCFRHLGNG